MLGRRLEEGSGVVSKPDQGPIVLSSRLRRAEVRLCLRWWQHGSSWIPTKKWRMQMVSECMVGHHRGTQSCELNCLVGAVRSLSRR